MRTLTPSWRRTVASARATARAVLVAQGLRPPGRAVAVIEGDTFVVSYPKSGNTWVRFLLATLLHRDDVDFTNIGRLVPDIYQSTQKQLDRLEPPRLLKSHEYFDARYRRVIYLVRDPRDVAVSYFHHLVKQRVMPEDCTLERYLDGFLVGSYDPYGSWHENVGSWLGARGGHEDFLLVRYEDLSRRPLQELQRVVGFIGLEHSEAQLRAALCACSAERMRELESRQARLTATLKDSRQDIPFIRSAKVGGWADELPARLAARITRAWGRTMAELGYLDAQNGSAAGPVRARARTG